MQHPCFRREFAVSRTQPSQHDTLNDIDQPTAERLLRECRELLEHDLGEFIDELGQVIAEEVLALIDSTRDEARKTDYKRLRADLQNRWTTLAAAYHGALSQQLQPVKAPVETKTEAPDFASLRLVSDQELTEQIVMREFVGRVREACSEEVYALDRRIGYLRGRDELDEGDGDNQFGPAGICAAVSAGCAAMYPDLDQYTLLLRQLERHLRSELPQLYRAINQVLIDAAILPTLKRSFRPSAPMSSPATVADAANIMSTILRLAQTRSISAGGLGTSGALAGQSTVGEGGGGGGAGGGPGGGRSGGVGGGDGAGSAGTAGAVALFESLQTLQTQQATTDAGPGALTNIVRLARESDAARQIPPLESITLDIVAMLFDLIFDDARVSNTVKGLVSRLQIPILKVAMSDQEFFANRSHPARRFLDSISGIAIRWGKTVDEGDPFYVELSRLIERIQSSFDQDVDVFGSAITELAAFVTENETREAENSRVVAEIVQRKDDELRLQRERQATARQAANTALAPLLETELPMTIELFLLSHWRDVLQNHALNSGTESTQFIDAVRIAGELVWSVVPKKTADERKRQGALLPKLVGALNQGLDQIGTTADARRLFMDALMDLSLAALHGDKRVDKEPPAVVAPATPAEAPVIELQVTHTVENGVRIEEVSLSASMTPADDSHAQDRTSLRRVKHLVRGDWVEFIDGEGQTRRERLTWISPRRSLFLFSNHSSHCAISITPEALAHRLQTESARLIVADEPMFERALDGAIKSLDQAA
jgi:hypothetical protein